ncbi:Sm-like protein LSM7 [Lachnellula suecica]|uniref:Sm-like protein LSM7 n=1 Tax=Lachnellula suecica TaxID=602035 RepID=A0A8T9C4M2_9HELO|nr:Sm-like protein LSM7 [Lachnellula suecica]
MATITTLKHSQSTTERPKTEAILTRKIWRSKLQNTKGYDALMNLVLDDASEVLHYEKENTSSRAHGLVVARVTLVLSPCDGSEEIAISQRTDNATKTSLTESFDTTHHLRARWR